MDSMTCYLRHLKHIFTKAGVEVAQGNREDVDKAIHDIVGVEYKNCASTWKEVKKRIVEDEEAFVAKVKKALTEKDIK
jgi:molecular chaperone GrpE (heat shock protein)